MTRLALLLLALLCACSVDEPASTVERVRLALERFRGAREPSDSAPELASARKRLAEGDFEGATQLLHALAQDEPTGEAWFLLGYAHQERQQYALALEPYARALAAGPGFPKAAQAFFLYGRCLQETGDLAGARAAYAADAELFPDKGDGLYRLALLDLEAGDLAASERNARTASERFQSPRDRAKVHAHLADIALARGAEQTAREELERCVSLFPHYEAFYKLSRICTLLGDHDAAARYLAQHEDWRRRAGR